MEYINCMVCKKVIASFDENSLTKNIHIQCRSCKAYNVINNNKAESFYVKVGKKEDKDVQRTR